MPPTHAADLSAAVTTLPEGVAVAVKAVPGASRSRIAGVLGDRLKVQVAAPPEAGKANAALCALLAEAVGVPAKGVEVTQGHASPRKTVRIVGISVATAIERLARSA